MIPKYLILIMAILIAILLVIFLTGFIINMGWFLKSRNFEDFPLRWIVLFIINILIISALLKILYML